MSTLPLFGTPDHADEAIERAGEGNRATELQAPPPPKKPEPPPAPRADPAPAPRDSPDDVERTRTKTATMGVRG